jgi:pilus assembly protein Flp/PilA
MNVMVMNLITRLRMLRRNDSGQDLLEYALLVALIALVAIGAITTTGTGVSTVFQDISDQLGTP